MKLAVIKNLFIALVSIFAPIKAVLIAAMTMTLIDLVTGVVAAKKQGQPITSSGLKRTVGKIFLYEIAILCAYATQKYLLQDSIAVTNLLSSYIGITELTSIMENLNSIQGSNIFKEIVNKISNNQNNTLQ